MNGPTSAVSRTAARPPTMSMRLWDLDWSRILPWTIGEVVVEPGSFDDAGPFMERYYAGIFGPRSGRFLEEDMTEAKRRFWDEMDVFAFRRSGETIGLCAGHPLDWSSYYIRTIAFLPSERERGLCGEYIARMGDALRAAGVARWDGDVSAANTAIIRMLLRNGAITTGTLSSERWGQVLRFTTFLQAEAEETFRRQFLHVPNFGRDAHQP